MAIAAFGPLVTAVDIDRAIVNVLRGNLDDHLREQEQVRGLSPLYFRRPADEAYATSIDEDDEIIDHRLPAIIVTAGQTVGEPYEANAGGLYVAAWRVLVTAASGGRTPDETRWLAAVYGGCVRRCLVQHTDLGGFASDVKWFSSRLAGPSRDDQGRYLAADIQEFDVHIDEVLQAGAGPYVPNPGNPDGPYPFPTDPEEPFDPLAEVAAVTTTITATPIQEG